MPLVDRIPFPARPEELAVRGERVGVRADQIIIWVSLSARHAVSQSPAAAPFPAVLDTGHTHTFAIRERHLVDWAGLQPETLRIRSAVRDRGQRLLLRDASLWLHPNRPRSRDRADRPPTRLRDVHGIAIYPGDFPRLPILGLQAITDNGLVLQVDGRRREATLRPPRRWWPFS